MKSAICKKGGYVLVSRSRVHREMIVAGEKKDVRKFLVHRLEITGTISNL